MDPYPRLLWQAAPRICRALLPVLLHPCPVFASLPGIYTEEQKISSILPARPKTEATSGRASRQWHSTAGSCYLERGSQPLCAVAQSSALSSSAGGVERVNCAWNAPSECDRAAAIRSSVAPRSSQEVSGGDALGGRESVVGVEVMIEGHERVSSKIFEERLSVSRRIRAASSPPSVASIVEEHLSSLDDRNVAEALAGLAALGGRYGGGCYEVDQAVHLLCAHLLQHGESYRVIEIVRSCAALVRYLRYSPRALLALLERRVASEAHTLPPRYLHLLLTAAVGADGKLRAVVDAVATEVARRECGLPTHLLAKILKTLARLKYSRRDVLASIAASASAKQFPWRMKPTELATVAWALGRLRVPAAEFYDAVVHRVLRNPSAFDPLSLTNVALGLSNARHGCEGLMWAVATDCAARPAEYTATSLANVAYACGGNDPAALTLLREPVFRRVQAGEMTGAEVVRVALAFARGWGEVKGDDEEEKEEGELFAAVAATLTPHLRQLHASQVANVLWAFATVEVYDGVLADAGAEAVLHRVATLRPQCLATLLWSLAKMRHSSDVLLDEVASSWGGRLGALSPRGLSMLAYAYAVLQPDRQPSMMAALAEQVEANHEEFSPGEIALTLWSLAAGGGLDTPVIEAVAPRLPHLPLSHLDTVQLLQAHCVSGGRLLHGDDGSLVERCRLASEGAMQSAPLSDTVVEVSDVLFEMGLPCQMGCVTGNGVMGFALEVGVGGCAVAVEVDGVGRFMRNAPDRVTGATALRRRMLEAQGYRVVNIPAAHWEALRDEASQQHLLCDLFLQQAGIRIGEANGGSDG